MNITQSKKQLDVEFWNTLKTLDKIESNTVQSQGCPHCGGKLHRADYPRKPRGLKSVSKLERRDSFCCADCRKRVTPRSLRFLGRKVYAFAIVIVVSYLREGREKAAMKSLVGIFGVTEITIRRWLRYWQGVALHSDFWREYKSFLVSSVGAEHFISSLYEHFISAVSEEKEQLPKLLRFLSPLSIGF